MSLNGNLVQRNLVPLKGFKNAINEENYEKCKALIKAGTDVNCYRNDMDNFPLLDAVTINNIKVVKLLIKNNADVNKESNNGHALYSKYHYYKTLRFFLKQGYYSDISAFRYNFIDQYLYENYNFMSSYKKNVVLLNKFNLIQINLINFTVNQLYGGWTINKYALKRCKNFECRKYKFIKFTMIKAERLREMRNYIFHLLE